MKTVKIYKLVAFLLFLVMCTTTVVCPTLARYATNTELTNEARVTKWGVTVSYPANSGTLFAYRYADGTYNNHYWQTSYGEDTITVKSETGSKNDIVAPGTYGYLDYPTVSGTPEVDVRISFATNLELTNWEVDGEEYCPIIFKIDYGSAMEIDGSKATDKYLKIGGTNSAGETINTVEQLIAAVEESAAAATTEFDANTDLNANRSKGTVRIFWCWPFSLTGNNFGTGALKNIDDQVILSVPEKDTYLCNLAADDDTTNDATISLTTSCTIEQID